MGQIPLFPSYCIDTSALIDAWRVIYPPDLFPTLWDNDLTDLISEGLLVAPQEVLDELKQRDDELFEWAKDQNHKEMFKDLDEEQVNLVRQIESKFPGLIDIKKSTADADPFIIALAKSRGLTVITSEKSRPRKPNIPDVCKAYDVKCVTLQEFFREQGWKFYLRSPKRKSL
jgi:hypothetical protein